MSVDQIERETTIEAPVERVWALLTEPEHVGRWFGDAGAEIDLRPGGEMVMRWAEHGARAAASRPSSRTAASRTAGRRTRTRPARSPSRATRRSSSSPSAPRAT